MSNNTKCTTLIFRQLFANSTGPVQQSHPCVHCSTRQRSLSQRISRAPWKIGNTRREARLALVSLRPPSGFFSDLTSDMTATRPRLSFLFLLHPPTLRSLDLCNLISLCPSQLRARLQCPLLFLSVSTVLVPTLLLFIPKFLLYYCTAKDL